MSMRHACFSTLIALAILVPAAVAPAAPRATRADATARELRALETTWDDAVVRKDRASLERIVADDFVSIGSGGALSDKQRMIAAVLDPELKIEPFETRDVVVRVYGDVAILTGWFAQRGSYHGNAYETASRYTDVYVRRNGTWRAVSAQSTRMPPPTPGDAPANGKK
jgi:ketosteroid isomerase-like protein